MDGQTDRQTHVIDVRQVEDDLTQQQQVATMAVLSLKGWTDGQMDRTDKYMSMVSGRTDWTGHAHAHRQAYGLTNRLTDGQAGHDHAP
jgi:hypothetical protein